MSNSNISSTSSLTNSSSTASAEAADLVLARIVISTRWDWTYIFASFCVATLGAATALTLIRQRASVKGLTYNLYFYGSSVVLGAVGIWCMHFVGMMAITLRDPYDTSSSSSLPMRFEPTLTAFSLIAAAVGMALAFAIAGDPKKQQIWRHLVGAVAGAGGVASMHYMGMAAMIFRGTIEYDAGIVAASLIVGFVTVLAAQIIIFRLHMFWTNNALLLIGASIVMGIAVCAVHYTGMASATYVYDALADERTNLPDLHAIFITTVALACTSCASMLAYLFYQYRHVLLYEISKADSLLLGAVVVDARGRILLTASSTLPSAIIDSRYSGQGVFDRFNPDFLRLFKIGLLWSVMPKYVKRMKSLGANAAISTYSVSLIERFEKAANQLADDLHIHVSRLGVMHWFPTKNMMTVVMRHSTSLGALDTSGMRWVERSQALTYLQPYLPEGRDPNDWLDEVLDYETKFRMPLTLERDAHHLDEFMRSVATDLLLDKEMIEQDVQEWRAALGRYVKTKHHLMLLVQNKAEWACIKLDPMVKAQINHSIGSPTADLLLKSAVTSNTVYVGLFFVSANTRGLQVLVPSNGPFHMVPIVPFGQSPALTSTHLAWLDYVKRGGPQKINNLANALSNKDKEKDANKDAGVDGVISPRHDIRASAVDGAGKSIPASPKASHAGYAQHSPVAGVGHLNDISSDNETSANGQTTGERVLRRNSSNGMLPQPDVLRMHAEFTAARRTLATILGTDKDLLSSRLLAHFISIAADCHVLLFCVCNMSSTFPVAYNSRTLHQLPLPMFEAMHYSQHSCKTAANWTRDVLAMQLKTTHAANQVAEQADKDDVFFGSSDISDTETSVAGKSVSRSRNPRRSPLPGHAAGASAGGGATAGGAAAGGSAALDANPSSPPTLGRPTPFAGTAEPIANGSPQMGDPPAPSTPENKRSRNLTGMQLEVRPLGGSGGSTRNLRGAHHLRQSSNGSGVLAPVGLVSGFTPPLHASPVVAPMPAVGSAPGSIFPSRTASFVNAASASMGRESSGYVVASTVVPQFDRGASNQRFSSNLSLLSAQPYTYSPINGSGGGSGGSGGGGSGRSGSGGGSSGGGGSNGTSSDATDTNAATTMVAFGAGDEMQLMSPASEDLSEDQVHSLHHGRQ